MPLDQVAERQAIADITPRDVDDEAQVREDELPGSIQVIVLTQIFRKRSLVLDGEDGNRMNGIDVGVQAPNGA
jgi:hypothetical protein